MVGWTERSPLVEGPPLPVDSENLPPLPLPQPQIPVGGRLAHFALNWQNITNDQWVLSLIKNGYQIPFKDQPPLSREPIFFQQSQRRELEEEVTSLLQKGAVEEIQPETPGFYSRIFLVPKKNGKLRLIIDLSTLNKYVFVQSFRMETQRKVRNAIRQNDWAFSLDLTDAYLHVPIHPRSRKYLRFTLKGRVFHFRALPFGLSTSPYIFTLLMTVIATYLRRRAIILHPYLDNWLSRNQSRLILLEHRHFIIQLITSLGLIINQEKSDLIPTQMFTFIGMEFLTHMNIVRVPQARVQILLETVKKFSQKTYVSAREFLSLLGQLNAAADFVMLGRLHLRPLQMSLLAQWRPQTLPLQHQIKLTADVLHHLNWWKQHRLYLQGVPMKADPPSHHIFSDASLTGWGSHLEPEGLLYHGVWSKTQSRLHINILEMIAISLTLRRALQFIKNSTVLISTDNTTVVAYLNCQGGTHSPDLCMEVWKTLIWCHQNQINLLIKHIPGKFNVLADLLSRITKPISTEWGLNQSVANAVFRMTQFRSVRNSSKSQTSTVCISDSGPKGTFNRRSHNELESHTWLCVSSFPSHSLSDKQNKNSSVQSGIDSPLLAQQNVVSRTTQSVDIITNNSPDKTKPTRTAPRKVFASKSRSSATSRMGMIQQSIRDKKNFKRSCRSCLQGS